MNLGVYGQLRWPELAGARVPTLHLTFELCTVLAPAEAGKTCVRYRYVFLCNACHCHIDTPFILTTSPVLDSVCSCKSSLLILCRLYSFSHTSVVIFVTPTSTKYFAFCYYCFRAFPCLLWTKLSVVHLGSAVPRTPCPTHELDCWSSPITSTKAILSIANAATQIIHSLV